MAKMTYSRKCHGDAQTVGGGDDTGAARKITLEQHEQAVRMPVAFQARFGDAFSYIGNASPDVPALTALIKQIEQPRRMSFFERMDRMYEEQMKLLSEETDVPCGVPA